MWELSSEKNCVQPTTHLSPFKKKREENQQVIVSIFPASFGIFGEAFIQFKLPLIMPGLGVLRLENPPLAAQCAGLGPTLSRYRRLPCIDG